MRVSQHQQATHGVGCFSEVVHRHKVVLQLKSSLSLPFQTVSYACHNVEFLAKGTLGVICDYHFREFKTDFIFFNK